MKWVGYFLLKLKSIDKMDDFVNKFCTELAELELFE